MKRRWITLGFLLAAAALGAWLIFSGKPTGRVSIRFLGYHTNDASNRSVLLWITNGHDFPVHCWFPVVTDYSGGRGFREGREDIGPHSALSQHFFPLQKGQVSTSVWQVEVEARSLKPLTRMEQRRLGLANWLYNRSWNFLARFVDPVHTETVLSEPIVLPPEIKRE